MSEEKKIKLTSSFDILEEAIKTWWKHLSKFIMVYVWSMIYALIPLAAIALLVIFNSVFGGGNQAINVITALLSGVAGLIVAYFAIRGQIGAFLLVKQDYQGQEKEIFKASAPWFWPYLGLSLLNAILVLLWMLLLFIPGIIYAVFYSLASYIFFFEGKRGLEAIKSSRELIRDYWWPIAGRLLVLGVFLWAIMTIVSVPLGSLEEHSLPWQLYNVFIQFISFLVGPITIIYSYRLYKELTNLKKSS